jgi:transcriptional regulator GlxA family with amidase domain
MKIRILVFEGADEIDFIAPHEIFRRAAKLSVGIEVRLVTLEPCAQITAAYGLRVVPDGVLDDTTDLVVVPGGGWADRSPRGIRTEIERGLLTQRIAALRSSGAVVAGVCTGTMALAAAGLLDGRPAVTHRSALQDLRLTAAEVIESRVVDDGDVVTCGGVTSAIDLALHLVERFWGRALAEKIASNMEYSRNPDVKMSATGQHAPAKFSTPEPR